MELKESILHATLEEFNIKGLKFTMDDIAKNLGISKKTIYTVFEDKTSLFYGMVDYLFDGIKESEDQVLRDGSLSTVEKIKKVLGVMPDSYKNIDLRQLYLLREKYPKIYKQVEKRLETGWDATLDLLERGVREGVVRPVNLSIVKMMMEATLEQFFQRDILIKNNLSYSDALNQVVEILIEGIVIKN